MRRLVLLGTGTGVGKTHLGVQLVRAWRQRGHPAWGLKPVESGVDGSAGPSDAERLRAAGDTSIDDLHLHALPDPISPHLAARRMGVEISLDEITAWIHRAEGRQAALHDNAPHAMSLVETAGGAWTPLSPAASCAHLARALHPARVVLVAPDALGVLHDVTATLQSLHAVRCRVDLVVLSEARAVDASTGTNASELERVVFPTLEGARPTVPRVFHLPAGSTDVREILDAWTELH